MTYGKRLESALTASGKSRKELAAALGVSPQAVGMVITGAGGVDRYLSAEGSARAARFLRVDGYWLATGEGGMEPCANERGKAAAQLSDDAQEIAIYFDKLKDAGDRTKAYVAAMNEILKIIAERERIAAAAIRPPVQVASPEKPHA